MRIVNQTDDQTFDAVFRDVLQTILKSGDRVVLGTGLSIGSERGTTELRNHGFTVPDTRDRLLFDTRFNLRAAVGRFAWMMSGSDRLADIMYYDPNARRFTDDGLTVPGSCDGARILYPRRGVDQLRGVIRALREDATSRRATMAIYHPEDAVRQSRDIPCILSTTFHIRDGLLHTTTVLRSSNAARVLPADLFLYSLVSEIVAAEVGVEPGSYHQFAISSHIYDEDVELAEAIVGSEPGRARAVMAAMPRGSALRDVAVLLDHERTMRAAVTLDRRAVGELLRRIDGELPPYWQDFSLVLLSQAMERHGLPAEDITARLGPAFQAAMKGPGV
ncbi:thymidylate synthase [Nonomuraea solani]|uniref:thymidylate synthase n=1 Tax=Nonomuraea solani TaxID=1144553 RepID=UPI000CDF278F|nr:thymidylate synthase [Nonomuraea solani]